MKWDSQFYSQEWAGMGTVNPRTFALVHSHKMVDRAAVEDAGGQGAVVAAHHE